MESLLALLSAAESKPTCCRKNFDKWWKGTWTTVKIPGKGTIYDYFVNFKTSKFTPWTDLVTDIDYDSGMPMSSLFVPTAETSSLRFFLDLMVGLKKPIMFVGGAGVGKLHKCLDTLPWACTAPCQRHFQAACKLDHLFSSSV